MRRASLNRATMRVADTTDVSGRVTADSIKLELYAKKQSSLWRSTIFGFCKVCSLVAATLILPALAYAQNNQGDDQGNRGRGIPNGTYVFTINGFLVPPAPGVSGQVALAAAGRETNFPDRRMNAGTTSGVTSFSIGGQVLSRVTFEGTFTVNADGSVSETDTQTSGPMLTPHFNAYPSLDGNTITTIQTDTGAIATGFLTGGR
jgi:hypothetical protein